MRGSTERRGPAGGDARAGRDPYISRIMRGSMVEVLESDYVTMARLKGLPERTVIWRHAVPNAIVPAIQVSALQLA